ncbi:MAG TPA: addiction module protein [Pyrinomonadaceae bacterium]|nr:addiction module protein [Pyrinomonadaceae bacterium]
MTKAEILEELPKLSREERQEIRLKLAELDDNAWHDEDDPLTEEQRALLEARLADMDDNPEASIPWDEAKEQIEARFRRSPIGWRSVLRFSLTSKRRHDGMSHENLVWARNSQATLFKQSITYLRTP